MALKAIIFGADGILAEIEEVRRLAFNQVFSEAGLDWHWGRSLYGTLLDHGDGKVRIAEFVKSQPRRWTYPDDVRQLIAAMHRREITITRDLIESGALDFRDGVRELLDAAEADGLRLAIATSLPRSSVLGLLKAKLGEAAIMRFDVIVADSAGRSNAHGARSVHARAVEALALDPRSCVAIVGSRVGAMAAAATGLPTIVTRSLYFQDEAPDTVAAIGDDLWSLVPDWSLAASNDQILTGDDLLAAVRRIHGAASYEDCTCQFGALDA